MKNNLQMLVWLKSIQKREVAVPVRLLDHMPKIPNRLVIVQNETKANGMVHTIQSDAGTKISTYPALSAHPVQLLHPNPSHALSIAGSDRPSPNPWGLTYLLN
jgi:hypothetical protein